MLPLIGQDSQNGFISRDSRRLTVLSRGSLAVTSRFLMPDAPSRFLPSDSASGAECCQHVHALTARATPPPENCSFLPQPSSRAAALSFCPIIHGQNRETRILTKFCHAKNGSNNHQHKGKSSVTGGGIRASRLRQELLAFLKRLHHEGKGRERESGASLAQTRFHEFNSAVDKLPLPFPFPL